MSVRTTYVYDRRVGRVVEKRSRDGVIELLAKPLPQWWTDYLKLMEDCSDIMNGRKPRHATNGQAVHNVEAERDS